MRAVVSGHSPMINWENRVAIVEDSLAVHLLNFSAEIPRQFLSMIFFPILCDLSKRGINLNHDL